MASVNGINANEKSMSGVVASPIGETVDCDVLNAPVINTQNINAIDSTSPATLYENETNTITIGTSGTNTINLGSFQFFLDNIRCATATLSLYLFTTTTAIIYFCTNASQIVFGSSTALVSAFVPTANDHLTNKLYVDNVVSGASLLGQANLWTNTNSYSSTLSTNTIQPYSGLSAPNLYASVVGSLNFGGASTNILNNALKNTFTNSIQIGTTAGRRMDIDTGTNNTVSLLFKTYGASSNTIQSSIVASAGSPIAYTGFLNLNGVVNFLKGFSFTNGNLASGTAYYIQTGNSSNQTALGGGASRTGAITFTDSFGGSIPFVIVSVEFTVTASLSRVTCSTCDVGITGFTWIASNPFSNASSAFRIRYIAIGEY
jgi:hypothetical protein